MRALDLFCGAGGASCGIRKAGFTEIIGVDNKPQPNYPFEFYEMDAIEFFQEMCDLVDFDFIWASPPCQAHSWGGAQWRNKGYKYADLIEVTRHHLEISGLPYIIENVVGAPLISPVRLCGTMFPGKLKVFRHRLFESNIPLKVEMKCNHVGHKAKERRNDAGDYFTVAGHNTGTTAEWSDAMGINWMTKTELAQAIPPLYSEYLVKQVINEASNYNISK
jgi:DNA (cytosine-5)-methyltransferase 1